jgi:hypothetical protein
MIWMAEEKFFYKYQSLEKVKDEDGKDRKYTIENLANNKLISNTQEDTMIHMTV